MRETLRTAMRAGVVAGVLSGLPSTLYSAASGSDPLEATAAAGSILLPHEERTPVLVAAAIPLHLTISVMWSLALALVLPPRRTILWGALAGLGIAALDLGPLARPFFRVRALRLGPQVADHLAFGAIAAAVIKRSQRSPISAGAT